MKPIVWWKKDKRQFLCALFTR